MAYHFAPPVYIRQIMPYKQTLSRISSFFFCRMPSKRPENFFKIFYRPIAAPFVFFPYTEKGPPFLRGEPFPEL